MFYDIYTLAQNNGFYIMDVGEKQGDTKLHKNSNYLCIYHRSHLLPLTSYYLTVVDCSVSSGIVLYLTTLTQSDKLH